MGKGGKGPPQVIPGLQAGDLMALMQMIESLKNQPSLKQIVGKFPSGKPIQVPSLLSGVFSPDPGSLLRLGSATNFLLGSAGTSVLGSILNKGINFKSGILPPKTMAKNLTTIYKSFGKGSLIPPLLGLKAAQRIFTSITSPFIMPAPSEYQVLLAAFANVLAGGSSGIPPLGQLSFTGKNPLAGVLQANQALSRQLAQKNQLFTAGAQSLATRAGLDGVDPKRALLRALNPDPRISAQARSFQISQGLLSGQGQYQSTLTQAVFGLLTGKSGAIPVALSVGKPGLLPFHLINAMTGGKSLLAALGAGSSQLLGLAGQASQFSAQIAGLVPSQRSFDPLARWTEPPRSDVASRLYSDPRSLGERSSASDPLKSLLPNDSTPPFRKG